MARSDLRIPRSPFDVLASFTLVVGLVTSGCGADSNSGPITVDAGPDTGASADTAGPADTAGSDTFDDAGSDTTDTAETTDAGDTGGDADVVEPLECRSASAAPAADRTELETGTWVLGSPSSTFAEGRLIRNIRDGSFTPPDPDTTKYSADWKAATPEDDGSISNSEVSGRLIYAATTLEVDTATTVSAEVTDMYRVYTNGSVQTADVYGHGDKRVPLDLEAGKNVIVLQFLNRQSPKFRVWRSTDPVVFNAKDKTTPELRVGTSTEQPLGLAVLNTSGRTMHDVEARVAENEYFEATTVEYPAVAPDAVTQLAFDLKPKSQWAMPDQKVPVTIGVTSCRSEKLVQTTLELKTVARGDVFRRTFRSPVDGSAQYYAVVPPKNFDPNRDYGLALTLHGAAVEGENQAEAYTRKEWLYIVAPTNRRRYGFNWESFGRLNGMNALDHAMGEFKIDPTKVYVTGHSMGGHGTWHFGVMHPGRFATIGPSAGWASIYTYTGADKPQGAIGRARAHSETNAYLANLADRGAYIVHGGADNNVPTQEGRDLRDALKKHTDDVKYHEEPGAKHWWDRDGTPGTDCVDWDPLFTFFKNHTLDPHELDFEFRSPGPWYSDEHSYVRVRSSTSPYEDFKLTSEKIGPSKVELTTQNVRSMDIDGQALRDKGVSTIVVDGSEKQVPMGNLAVGPRDGKKPGQNGTFNQVFHDPFCFVYPKNGPEQYRDYATFLTSVWSVRGNGHACAISAARVDDELRSSRNLVYLGVSFDEIPGHENRPFGWSADKLEIGDWSFEDAAALVVFPDGEEMAAAIVATESDEHLVFRHQPFTSRANMPDYLVFSASGGQATGFFDNQWKFDPDLGGRAN